MADRRVTLTLDLDISKALADVNRVESALSGVGGRASAKASIGDSATKELQKALNLTNKLLDQYDNKLAKIGGYDSELRRLNKTLSDSSVAQHIDANTQALLREQAALVDTAKAQKSHQSAFVSAFGGAALGGFTGAAIGQAVGSEVLSAVKAIPGDAIAAGTAIFDLTKASSDFGSQIFDTGQKVSLSAQAISTIKLAADISSSSLEAFTGGFIKFEKNLAEAAHGNEKLGKTFRALSIDVQAGVRDPEAAFSQFLATFNKLPESADRAAINIALFGKSGAQLTPTFIELGSSFDKAKEKAERLGLTFDSDAAAAADRFGDTLDTVKKQVTGVGYTIGEEFTPIFTDALSTVSDLLANNKNEIKDWAAKSVDFFYGVEREVESFGSTAEKSFDGANNFLRGFGTTLGPLIIKVDDLVASLTTLGLINQGTLHSGLDAVEKITAAGAEDSERRKTLQRAANARSQFENNKINFATGKVVGDAGPDLSFLGGDEGAKKAEASARKAEEAVKKLGAQQREVIGEFRDLTTRANAENPFVRIYDDAAKSMAKVRLETRGVSQETQALFDLQRQITSKAVFSARLETALGAFNLRDQADTFRKGAPKEVDTRLLTDKDFLKIAQGLPDAKGFLGENNQFKSDFDRASFAVKYLRGQIEDPNKALQDKIDRQIGIINDVQRTKGDANTLGLADKSIIALTQGLKPEDLTSKERDVAAGAREREAGRLEANEKAANELRARQTASVEKLEAKFERLIQLAEDKGLKVLDASPDADKPQQITVKANNDNNSNAGRMPALR